jgi:DNA-binding MurR/RpiR family transcriptional regulator
MPSICDDPVVQEKQEVLATLHRLRSLAPALKPRERQAVAYLLASPCDVLHYPIDEVARRAGTSAATLSRLCRAVGYSNWDAFKDALRRDLTLPPTNSTALLEALVQSPAQELAVLLALRRAFRVSLSGLYGTLCLLDLGALERAVAELRQARQRLFLAIGDSGLLAMLLHRRLLRLGMASLACTDALTQVDAARALTHGDVALAISFSGETRSVVEAIHAAGSQGAVTIAVTHAARSALATAAQIVLLTGGEHPLAPQGDADPHGSTMLVLDALYVALSTTERREASR